MMVKILAPGDIHCHPDYDNDRMRWLGKLVVEERPTHVVFPGDTGDYPSICSYERKKARAEGKRLAKDEAAVADGFEKFLQPLRDLHVQQRAARRARYVPELICLGGNHDEERLWRVGDDNPEFSGLEEQFKELVRSSGFRYVDYRTTTSVAGFTFSHHFGLGARPASSPTALLKAAKGESVVSGHCHTQRSSTSQTTPSGRRWHAIFLGAYTHLDYTAHWCKDMDHLTENGVTILTGCKGGDYEGYSWISQRRLKDLYG